MRIEKIQPRTKAQSVEFDTGDIVEIANDVAAEFVLFRGKELSEEQFADLRREQELFDAMTAAHRFLGYRVRSEREVREKLAGKKFSYEAIERAIKKLHEGNYLDDGMFALKYVHDALLKKPFGRTRLRQDLRRKGITDLAIDDALADQFDAGKEFEAAMRLAERRATKSKNEPLFKQKNALRQYLLSRGFSRETIDAAIREIFDNFVSADNLSD